MLRAWTGATISAGILTTLRLDLDIGVLSLAARPSGILRFFQRSKGMLRSRVAKSGVLRWPWSIPHPICSSLQTAKIIVRVRRSSLGRVRTDGCRLRIYSMREPSALSHQVSHKLCSLSALRTR